MTTPKQLKSLYERGVNISQFLRKEHGVEQNTGEIIEIAYELQTGTYVAQMKDAEMAKLRDEFSREIAETIFACCEPSSVLEAGVGEATTLSGVLKHLGGEVISYGFDLSWSRVAYAKNWLRTQGFSDTTLCTGDLFYIPFSNDSIDVVYTSHAIEPNGGNEEPILRELYRITRKYLILLEPGYELADIEAQERMESHGYCRNLKGTAEQLGYVVLEHKLFPFTVNPLNPTAVTVIRKDEVGTAESVLACPKFKTPLREIGGSMFSPEALVAYPIIGGIPCLRIESGIFASKFEELSDEGLLMD